MNLGTLFTKHRLWIHSTTESTTSRRTFKDFGISFFFNGFCYTANGTMLMPYRGRYGPGGLEGVRYEFSGGIVGVGSVCFQAFKSLRYLVLATSRGQTGDVRKKG